MQELNVYQNQALREEMQARTKADMRQMARSLAQTRDTKTTYAIPQDMPGVVFGVGTEAGAVKLTINGSEYMLTPDGARDLGNGLLKLAAILRGDKPKRRRHGHGRKNER